MKKYKLNHILPILSNPNEKRKKNHGEKNREFFYIC